MLVARNYEYPGNHSEMSYIEVRFDQSYITESSRTCSGQNRVPVSQYVLRIDKIRFSFHAMKQLPGSVHLHINTVFGVQVSWNLL
jgi:hypothetical protein